MSFAEPLAQSFRLVTEYFTALSQRNLDALSRTLHFPFAINEGIEPVVVSTAADLLASPPPTLNTTGRGTSRIMPGSYDLLESMNVHLYCNLPEFIELAGGAVGPYAYTRDRPVRPITIHATHDKTHTINGYLRYTADGNLISETRGVGIRIYKAGHWASAGGLGQVTHHDRSNSKS